MVASLDTRTLDPEEAERISDALDRIDLEHVGESPPAAPGAADTFHYQLEVRRGESTHEAGFGEREMPAELAELVGELMRHAEPAR
jgi:hypothetical protein